MKTTTKETTLGGLGEYLVKKGLMRPEKFETFKVTRWVIRWTAKGVENSSNGTLYLTRADAAKDAGHVLGRGLRMGYTGIRIVKVERTVTVPPRWEDEE